MAELRTPGVYVRPVQPLPVLRALRTDVAGFVGIAERGPLHRAERVTSWERFRERFGGFRAGAYLAYAVKGFFDNGGRVAWVVRVADPDTATPAAVSVPSASRAVRLTVTARSPGIWGRRLAVRLVWSVRAATTIVAGPDGAGSHQAASTAGIQPGSLVRIRSGGATPNYAAIAAVDPLEQRIAWLAPVSATAGATIEVMGLGLTVLEDGRPVEQFTDLSLRAFSGDPPEGAATSITDVIGQSSARIDIQEAVLDPVDLPNEGTYPLDGGADGLRTLAVEHLVGYPHRQPELGLQRLDEIDEVALVAVPDAMARPRPVPERLPDPALPAPCVPCEPERPPAPPGPPAMAGEMPPGFSIDQIVAIQAALLAHCEDHRDRFALLDPPDPDLERAQLLDWRRRFDSSYGGAYLPWLEVIDPLAPGSGSPLSVPPCGHIAGSYAAVDLTEGVHVAAANRRLAWVTGLTASIDDRLHAELNPVGLNCIRPFRGRGIRAYGARTVSSNSSLRYINVRRLLMLIAETLEEQLAWAVFEPHDVILRQKIVIVASGFLRSMWSAGALRGEAPEQAFFVRCDDVTNPPEVVAAGELRALVGVAPVRPAEFVLLRLGRAQERLEIQEQGAPWR